MEEFMFGELNEAALAGFAGIARQLTVGQGKWKKMHLQTESTPS